MLLRCMKEFTTRENGGVPFTLLEGTDWYKAGFDYAPGGYEIVILEQVRDGGFTGVTARVRLENFNRYMEPVPLRECPAPKVELDHGDAEHSEPEQQGEDNAG